MVITDFVRAEESALTDINDNQDIQDTQDIQNTQINDNQFQEHLVDAQNAAINDSKMHCTKCSGVVCKGEAIDGIQIYFCIACGERYYDKNAFIELVREEYIRGHKKFVLNGDGVYRSDPYIGDPLKYMKVTLAKLMVNFEFLARHHVYAHMISPKDKQLILSEIVNIFELINLVAEGV